MNLLHFSQCIGLCAVSTAATLLAPPVPFPGTVQDAAIVIGASSQTTPGKPVQKADPKPGADSKPFAREDKKVSDPETISRSPLLQEPTKNTPSLVAPVGVGADDNVPLPNQSTSLSVSSLLLSGAQNGAVEKPHSLSAKEPVPRGAQQTPEPIEVGRAPIIGTANRIVVPSIEIDIAVQSGSYDTITNSWQVDDTSAFHASTTVPVNDTNGTALIYGHAKWGIFGALPDLLIGAEATVFTSEGTQFLYVLESVGQVDSADVSMLTAEGKPRLILQTCSGLFDQHRTLASFTLKGVIEP